MSTSKSAWQNAQRKRPADRDEEDEMETTTEKTASADALYGDALDLWRDVTRISNELFELQHTKSADPTLSTLIDELGDAWCGVYNVEKKLKAYVNKLKAEYQQEVSNGTL